MTNLWLKIGQVRANIFVPNVREVDPERRGFLPWSEGESKTQAVGEAFLRGLREALRQPTPQASIRALSQESNTWRGFAFEGAGMGWGIRDALAWGRPRRWADLNAATSGRHVYLTTVGLGWALAKLPRFLWPDLRRVDPMVAPLLLDGYGFYFMFFNTATVLKERTVPFPRAKWPGPAEDIDDHLMQGIGRALWFVSGANPDEIVNIINGFDARHRDALWAGVGLAATYAGGVSTQTLHRLTDLSGASRPWLRQGSAFAAEARHHSQTGTDPARTAAQVLCGRTIEEIIEAVRKAQPEAWEAEAGRTATYQSWRIRLAEELSADRSDRVAKGEASLGIH